MTSMPTKKKKKITKKSPGVVIELFCEPEEISIEGNALASGDDEQDREAEQWIRDQLDRGNDWAWCTAHVRVTYKDILVADEYLGGCSYESANDFKKGGYYDDMVDTCIDQINEQLTKLKT